MYAEETSGIEVAFRSYKAPFNNKISVVQVEGEGDMQKRNM